MRRDEFEKIVIEAIDDLPEEFSSALENLAIVVEEWPTAEDLESTGVRHGTLLGLYRGVPKPERVHGSPLIPDKIVVFAGPILTIYPRPDDARKKIRDTILHEIGHYFGMREEQIRRAGK
ncbi:MAG: hypothetical protein UX91_C0010G0002 [Candidatus Amesbacteria bacterium GW2011_GWB1_47_19]|nr:MAG: hypothetical protein UW51_C0010G0002 [Candidatus Amesbacteria bacterium GW2011_GWA1_44_24]KKU30864.1 MAG: hypothetical protein UX46_C0010G0002 [Candidatus Amesbacteria bacterium GW2011_GWC1_46_24]KKU66553.1 MAG: hypothetical protein UX91_C0010G0002 [Candidatus Amesbacteria bacterium GW2011_GWB1_47_19]OGD05854.1 MAG: hypothetical protein A2379_01965 [Candidatus Amesbacteria bacterium RIFOXYB1_FULL_47_13]HBC73083.1 hypothetical protein [Candidatus Amesbacteria bacterium]